MTTPAPPLSLGGSLADFPLADVLMFLNLSQVTGAIEARSGSKVTRIYLERGEVIWASSSADRFVLTTFLTARGLLSVPAAREVDERARRSGGSLTRLILSAGLVPPNELEEAEKILCSEIVFDGLRWREGKFAFLKDRSPAAEVPALKIGVQNLILEGARRDDEARRFEEEVHVDRSTVLSLAFGAEALDDQLVLTPLEWGVVALINGKRSLEEILVLSPTGSEAETWQILQRLIAARMVRLHPAAGQAVQETLHVAALSTEELASVAAREPLLPDAAPPPPDRSDVHLLVKDDVTTKVGMWGRRVPARLVGALGADGKPASIELSRNVQTIGRSSSNDIVLPDPSVSKHHAQVVQEEDGWRLMDLESTNGTFVNGERTDAHRLAPGDTVLFGVYTFVFELLDRPASRTA